MLRFHLDENVSHALAITLRDLGFDVTTTPPDMPKKAPDEAQLAFTLSTMRVIITHDPDMLVLARGGVAHAGIAFNEMRTKTIGQITRRLATINREVTPEIMVGRVEFV